MLTITLAYSTENQHSAHLIAEDLADYVTIRHVVVGKANEGPVLADLLTDNEHPLVVLISHAFLTNPNCMLHAERVFGATACLPVLIDSHTYDELQDEIITTPTRLDNQAEVMEYVNHWQDRYIDLRRNASEMEDAAGEGYRRYLSKIRETSVGAEDVLQRIRETWSVTGAQFAANDYQQLFIFADRPRLWDDYRARHTAGDVSGIPGMDQLAAAAARDDDGARTQVPREVEGAGVGTNGATAPEAPPPPEATDPAADEQADIWIERAWALYDKGDAPAALELLAAGRDALPDDPGLHYHHALILATSTEDPTGARREVEALLERYPEHLDAHYLLGELQLAAGDARAARESWEALADLEPFYPELNYRLGRLLAERFPAEYLDAASYLRRATKDDEPVADAFYHYALLLAGPLNKKAKAIKVLRKGLTLDPDHAYAHYELAVLLHATGDYAGARLSFRLATTLNPAFDTVANRRAFAAVQPPGLSGAPAEENALAELKANVARLEAMIANRAPQTTPAPASAPPKPGAGQTVLISGATSGIGRATARRLAPEGYRLILLGRRMERLEELASELYDGQGTETYLLQCDIRSEAAVSDVIAQLPDDWRTVDVLINNAGKAKGTAPVHEGRTDHWDEMIDVNLKGLLYLTRAVTPGMVERRSGFVVNVCSTAGKEVYPGGNVYCATKHAVDALTHAMRLDFVPYGLRVGQICPAMVEETEFSLVRFDGDAERAKIYEDFQPLRSPDVAEAIHFMISQPAHVNVLDLVLQGTQQASSTVVDRSGRARYAEEE